MSWGRDSWWGCRTKMHSTSFPWHYHARRAALTAATGDWPERTSRWVFGTDRTEFRWSTRNRFLSFLQEPILPLCHRTSKGALTVWAMREKKPINSRELQKNMEPITSPQQTTKLCYRSHILHLKTGLSTHSNEGHMRIWVQGKKN